MQINSISNIAQQNTFKANLIPDPEGKDVDTYDNMLTQLAKEHPRVQQKFLGLFSDMSTLQEKGDYFFRAGNLDEGEPMELFSTKNPDQSIFSVHCYSNLSGAEALLAHFIQSNRPQGQLNFEELKNTLNKIFGHE